MFYAIKYLSSSLKFSNNIYYYSLILVQGFAGLILVDNIHFQYNTLLLGLFLFSLAFIFNGSYIKGAILYTIVLNMKHIFLYFAPAYFIIYLKYYVFKKKTITSFLLLVISILSVFFISFLPFILEAIKVNTLEPIIQIFRRMFPFQRGLLHSYWAPNFWAIYTFIDKVALRLLFPNATNKMNLSSLGQIGEISFDVLYDITPKFINVLLISLSSILVIYSLFVDKYEKEKKNENSQILKYLIISSSIFFNFGFHVHEKALIQTSILIIIHYMNKINSNQEKLDPIHKNRKYVYLAILVGCFAQMPLIHNIKDYIPKLFLIISFALISNIILNLSNRSPKSKNFFNIIRIYIILNLLIDFIITIYPHLDLTTIYQNIYPNAENINNFTSPEFNSNVQNDLISKISFYKEKYQFLPLMSFSVINSLVLQLIFIKSLTLE